LIPNTDPQIIVNIITNENALADAVEAGSIKQCLSAPRKLSILSRVESVEVTNYRLGSSDFSQLYIKQATPYTFKLRLIDFMGAPIANQNLFIDVNVLQAPPYLAASPKSEYLILQKLSATSNSQGLLDVK
jgi:hypothetical protein